MRSSCCCFLVVAVIIVRFLLLLPTVEAVGEEDAKDDSTLPLKKRRLKLPFITDVTGTSTLAIKAAVPKRKINVDPGDENVVKSPTDPMVDHQGPNLVVFPHSKSHGKGKEMMMHSEMSSHPATNMNEVEEAPENSSLHRWGKQSKRKLMKRKKPMDEKTNIEEPSSVSSSSNGELQKGMTLRRRGTHNFFNHIDNVVTEQSRGGDESINTMSDSSGKEFIEEADRVRRPDTAKRGRRYLKEFILKVLKEAKESSVIDASEKYHIPRSTIHRWKEIYNSPSSRNKLKPVARGKPKQSLMKKQQQSESETSDKEQQYEGFSSDEEPSESD